MAGFEVVSDERQGKHGMGLHRESRAPLAQETIARWCGRIQNTKSLGRVQVA